MKIDPQSPASEMTVRSEIALRIFLASTAKENTTEVQIVEAIMARSIILADKFIDMLNQEPDDDTEEESDEFFRKHYL
ncbi:hypothetical protein [Dyadobacter sp. LHD-138]|uniref:hypothetical protein n=1 Tax=Dyadobacter sp. LHD-138 TaxID=3071413 RepID=UPI0027E06F44|nr:hypothetical protein [Dyadobacter sp. LHD-138]MDQ6482342.1 hypothetical protein [Dyadobacter sp. LHD-138]